MQITLAKRALVQLATAAVLIVALSLGYTALAASRAEAKAQAACSKIPVGTTAVQAASVVRELNLSPSLQLISPDHIAVGFRAALGERWFCDAYLVEGVVSRNEVRPVN
ncbi:hypothetical protein [Ideonella sp. YS5]|uniref:hypothetical protein n=1 Tax=Ideonella sp. YS5 TaxID=3453714 RepID=UPI003EED6ECE